MIANHTGMRVHVERLVVADTLLVEQAIHAEARVTDDAHVAPAKQVKVDKHRRKRATLAVAQEAMLVQMNAGVGGADHGLVAKHVHRVFHHAGCVGCNENTVVI